jgi:hypothetical protein
MPLTQNEAIALLVKSAASKGKGSTGSEKYGTIDENGKSVVIHGKVPRAKIGDHIGKAGGIKRTRKGATRRDLTGSRKYVAGNVITEEILWYKL